MLEEERLEELYRPAHPDRRTGQPDDVQIRAQIDADVSAKLSSALQENSHKLHLDLVARHDMHMMGNTMNTMEQKVDIMHSQIEDLLKENQVLRSQNEEIWKLLRELQAHRRMAYNG